MTHPATVRARSLRLNMTDEERLLWRHLRAGQLGAKFRRQMPIGSYFADFVCIAARLVVEVDGGQHNSAASDMRRDAFLRQQGYRVLRFWNSDVHGNLEGVLVTIKKYVDAVNGVVAPPPNLPHAVGDAHEPPSPPVGRAGVGRVEP